MVLLAACGGEGAVGTVEDPVVAVVEAGEVHRSDVARHQAEARLNGETEASAAALERAIDEQLLRLEAERLGIEVTAVRVQKRLRATSERLGGDAALQAALAAASMSEAQFREVLAAGTLRDEVRDARFGTVKASADEARRFYEDNREALFVEPAAVKLKALLARNAGIAGNAVARLRSGRPFSEVARQFSIDPELRQNGGEYGWVQTASLPDPLARAVTKLRVGEVSAPVEGPGGAWVFELRERRVRQVTPFGDVRRDIERLLTAQKRDRLLERWLADRRAGARMDTAP